MEEIEKLDTFGKFGEDRNKTIIVIPQRTEEEKAKNLNPDLRDIPIKAGVGEHKTTLQLQYPLDLSESTKPNAKIEFTKGFFGGPKVVREGFQNQGYYDEWGAKNVPEGTIILAPVDGYLLIHYDKGVPKPSNGSDNAGAIIDFVDPKSGSHYRLGIYGQNPVTDFIFQSLINAPPFHKEVNRKVLGTYGIPIKKGDPILKTVSPIVFGVTILVAREGKLEQPTDMGNPLILTTIEFLTTSDGKLILPQK